MANQKGKRKWIVIAVVLAISVGGGVGGYFWSKRQKPITVQTEKVKRRNLTELVTANGKVFPVVQVVINPEVPGEIVALPVKEGQLVKKGDLLVKIRPDTYVANVNSAEASYKSALSSVNVARANLDKAEIEFQRASDLHKNHLVSDSQFLDAKTALAVAKASYENNQHQTDQVRALLDSRKEELAKTTILAPIDGTVTKLKSEVGERVVGSSMMAGTEIMTVANLEAMEARIDIGEVDIVLMQKGQKARVEVDSFRDRKFEGVVTEVANAAKTAGLGTQQEATKFEVRVRLLDKERFRPGMSVTVDVETRYRTNVLTAPIQSVTTRLPKDPKDNGKKPKGKEEAKDESENDVRMVELKKRAEKALKPQEVVFTVTDGKAKMLKVKRGISDNDYHEILEGLTENQEIVSGGYKAINKELEDDKLVKVDNESKPNAKPTSNP